LNGVLVLNFKHFYLKIPEIVQFRIQKGTMHLPTPEIPAIFIGPGKNK